MKTTLNIDDGVMARLRHEAARRRCGAPALSRAARVMPAWPQCLVSDVGVCYEFLRVITHPRVLRTPWSCTSAVEFLDAIQAAPALSMLAPTERHASVLAEVTREVPGIADVDDSRPHPERHTQHTALTTRLQAT